MIVDYATLLSVLSRLPLNFIGLTLLAWGNSLPDLFVDSALAKKGYGQAAISGIFAGQYFNLSVGFGLSLIRQVIAFGPVDFSLTSNSNTNIVNILLIVFLMLSLIVTMLYGYFKKYVLKKDLAIYLVISYGAFFLAVTLLSCFAKV